MLRLILISLALILTESEAWAAEPQAPPIPVVKAADDLRKLPPAQLADGQEVRVGMTEAAEGSPWRLIYCLMIDPKGPANDPQGDPEDWLGPVMVRIAEGREVLEVTGPLDDKQHKARSGKLFSCTAVPVSAAGIFHVDVLQKKAKPDDTERVLYRSAIEVKAAAPCYWHRFAVSAGDGKNGGDQFVIAPRPTATRPRFSGMVEYAWPADAKDDLPLDGIDHEHSLEISLDMSVADPKLQIKCADEMLDSAKDHLLARWWVNGKPVTAAPPEVNPKVPPRSQGWRMSFTKEIQIPFALPQTLGQLKPGDRVTLQVMYSPAGIKPCYAGQAPPLAPQPQFIPRIVAHPATLPRLSNPLEITVTKEMLQ